MEKKGERIIVIFGLENGNEHYIDILGVETFVTEVSDLFLQNSLFVRKK